ncbi:hypothetical protein BD410DRAFT_296910 [Rickenella mellea]|uniref:Uncharacterized protein n=1 Tax=Rickenella mellea TaxID=50990 RepID=A0A4Y7Q355_9AGAM|nr:hypothetical protein BD410DRAFT_296910 [Rickenella mellea]
MPRRHLLTTHNIFFTILTVASLVPKVVSIYHGETLSLNSMDWVFGVSIVVLFFWLEKFMDHQNSGRWHWYFDEHFPSMALHFLRDIMLTICSRHRASSNTGQNDSVLPEFLDHNVTEESSRDDHASADRPTFHSYLDSTIPHHTPLQAQAALLETFQHNPMFPEPQSNTNPLNPASISRGGPGGPQPGPAENIEEIDRTVQRNTSGTSDDDGSLDISRGSVDITSESLPFASRYPYYGAVNV